MPFSNNFAHTYLTSSFTQPAIGSTVTANVGNTAGMIVGQYLSIVSGGLYTISSIINSTSLVVTNLGHVSNAAPAATVSNNSAVLNAGRPVIIGGAVIASSESTSSTSYVDLTTVGPTVTIVTGTSVRITIRAAIFPATTGETGHVSIAVSGATTLSATTVQDASGSFTGTAYSSDSIAGFRRSGAAIFILNGLTPGTNTFTAKYKTASGNSVNFESRWITIEAL